MIALLSRMKGAKTSMGVWNADWTSASVQTQSGNSGPRSPTGRPSTESKTGYSKLQSMTADLDPDITKLIGVVMVRLISSLMLVG